MFCETVSVQCVMEIVWLVEIRSVKDECHKMEDLCCSLMRMVMHAAEADWARKLARQQAQAY